jgi:Memo-like protein
MGLCSCTTHELNFLHTADRKRVFLLGPSHHMYTQDCLLSQASAYHTPIGEDCETKVWSHRHAMIMAQGPYDWTCCPPDAGSIDIDTDVYRELAGTGIFKTMNLRADEVRNVMNFFGSITAWSSWGQWKPDDIAVRRRSTAWSCTCPSLYMSSGKCSGA